MNGIYVETQDGVIVELVAAIRNGQYGINGSMAVGNGWRKIAEYSSEQKRDFVWQMLRNAISSGAHYFKFPTDAELEKGEDE